MTELKKIHPEAVPHALERVERYRLLNQPRVAESICLDILAVDENNQQALIALLLALTDQFGLEATIGVNAALKYVQRLEGKYAQASSGNVTPSHASIAVTLDPASTLSTNCHGPWRCSTRHTN